MNISIKTQGFTFRAASLILRPLITTIDTSHGCSYLIIYNLSVYRRPILKLLLFNLISSYKKKLEHKLLKVVILRNFTQKRERFRNLKCNKNFTQMFPVSHGDMVVGIITLITISSKEKIT